MGWAAVFITLVGGPIIAGTLIASIFQSYTRETTGIFERWDNKTIEQRQALKDAAANIDIDPNDSNRADSPLLGDGNHDGDCLTDAEENNLGLDPRNPDTDGDGVDDCIEIANNTDPLDPLVGGLGAAVPPRQSKPPLAQLYIDNVVKTVNNQHLVEVSVGSILNFHLHVDAYMTGTGTKTVVIEDTLSSRLRFIEGTVGDSSTNKFTAWPGNWEFEVGPGSHKFDIYFTAQVTGNTSDTIFNKVTAHDKTNPLINGFDLVSIGIQDNAGNPPPPPPAVIDLFKTGRVEGTTSWYRYVFAENGDEVEFRILAETSQDNLTLRDLLPTELEYKPQTLRLLFNNFQLGLSESQLLPVFDQGILLNRGAGIYELRFSVTVNSDSPFALTNRTSITRDQTELESSESIVTTK